jgi:hypothetical protein
MLLIRASSPAAAAGVSPRPLLFEWPCGDRPEFDEVLRDDMKVPPQRRQNLERASSRFVMRMANLKRAQKCAGIDKQRLPYIRSA